MQRKKQGIKTLALLDRPREKLLRYGPDRLLDAELLAIILGSGSKAMDVLTLAKHILKKYKNSHFHTASLQDLMNISGIGEAKACEIIACFELGKRFLLGKQSTILLSPQQVWDELSEIRKSKKEHLIIFYLDHQQQEIKREVISVGILNATLVHPREVFEPAIRNLAFQVLIAHNHPSGNCEPSEEDLALTTNLVQVGKVLDIQVLDHVIVSTSGYFSFKEQGLLE